MASVRTGNARLLRLAAFLRKLPPKRFNYAHWVGENWQGDADLSCGTTACALGWATTIPSLRRAGLVLHTDEVTGGAYVTLREHTNVDSNTAACAVFYLSYRDAERLFYPRQDEADYTPKQVAEKIEGFVRMRS